MGEACCRRENYDETEINPIEMPENVIANEKSSLKKIDVLKKADPKKIEELNNIYGKMTEKIVQIQSWFRGIKSRKMYTTTFGSQAIIKYIGTCFNTNDEVKKVEEKLGPFKLSWDIEETTPTLGLRKPITDSNGCIYHGYWSKITNMKEGYGQQIFPNGSKYEGFWKSGEFEGEGRFIYETGDYYQGSWKEGQTCGQGTFISKDGMKYTGQWKNNLHHGYGQESWEDGSKFEGNYVDGRKEGKGTFVWNDGSTYTGDFLNNKLNGKGNIIKKVILYL